MRSVSLAEALYVNEGTVSPSSLHSPLHSLSHLAHFLSSLPPKSRSSRERADVLFTHLAPTHFTLTERQRHRQSQWVPMGLNGPAGPLSACKRSSSLQALSSRSSTLSSCSPSSTALRVFIHPNGPNDPTCPTGPAGPAGTLSTLHSPQDHSSSLQWSLRAL